MHQICISAHICLKTFSGGDARQPPLRARCLRPLKASPPNDKSKIEAWWKENVKPYAPYGMERYKLIIHDFQHKPSACPPSYQAECCFVWRPPRQCLSQPLLGLTQPRLHARVRGTGLETPGGVISGFRPWPVRTAAECYPCPGLTSWHSPESKANTSEQFWVKCSSRTKHSFLTTLLVTVLSVWFSLTDSGASETREGAWKSPLFARARVLCPLQCPWEK